MSWPEGFFATLQRATIENLCSVEVAFVSG
jgi:hypothetical protein